VAIETILTKKLLHNLFFYKNGRLFYKDGKKTPCRLICIGGFRYKLHRLIFMFHNGFMPIQVDHIDRNPLNNCIENLRAANNQTNSFNKIAQKNCEIGIKNICWHKKAKKWMVTVNKKYIGLFKDLELAELVAIEARNKYHGVFANHG